MLSCRVCYDNGVYRKNGLDTLTKMIRSGLQIQASKFNRENGIYVIANKY